MEPGIFTVVFQRESLEATLDAIAAQGIRQVQFDLESAGLTTIPEEDIPAGLAARIRSETSKRGIEIAAISGHYNMAHPNPDERERGLNGLRRIINACHAMGASVVTLSSGTRDRENMWRRHPQNDSIEAWRDLLSSLTVALTFAEENDVVLAFEPEPGNLANTPARARRLLDEMQCDYLGIVADAANISDLDPRRPAEAVLREAFELFGDQVAVAHAKDHTALGKVVPAGQGVVPWDTYIALLRGVGFDGPLILHGLTEADAPGAVAYLRERPV